MFKTELHCHSCEVSECARASARELAERYTSEGYSTVVLTNHFAIFTYNYLKSEGWQDWIDKYINGYEMLKKEAQGKLEILLGIELRPKNNPNDFLFYGVSEEFLRKNEFLFDKSVEELSKIARENNILFIQAHPFRNNMQITNPNLIDGIEVHNGSAGGHYGTDSRNDIALAWAEKFNLIKTSGTDLHYPNDKINSGIITNEKITSIAQLVNILKNGDYSIISY